MFSTFLLPLMNIIIQNTLLCLVMFCFRVTLTILISLNYNSAYIATSDVQGVTTGNMAQSTSLAVRRAGHQTVIE